MEINRRYETLQREIAKRLDGNASDVYLLIRTASRKNGTESRYLANLLAVPEDELEVMGVCFDLDVRLEEGGKFSFSLDGFKEHIGEGLVAEIARIKMGEMAAR